VTTKYNEIGLLIIAKERDVRTSDSEPTSNKCKYLKIYSEEKATDCGRQMSSIVFTVKLSPKN